MAKDREEQEKKISLVGAGLPCQFVDKEGKRCEILALSLADYCWEHHPDKAGYRSEILDRAQQGENLEKFLLTYVDFSKANLTRANLQGVCLGHADLRGAVLWHADLRGACLFEAKMAGADLRSVSLQDAVLSRATVYDEKGFIKQEREKKFEEASIVYRNLKNNYREAGMYPESGEAFYKEMRAKQKHHWKSKKIGRWTGLYLMNLICGYGERPWRVILFSLGLIAFCAL